MITLQPSLQGQYKIPERIDYPLRRWDDAVVLLMQDRIFKVDETKMLQAVGAAWTASNDRECFINQIKITGSNFVTNVSHGSILFGVIIWEINFKMQCSEMRQRDSLCLWD